MFIFEQIPVGGDRNFAYLLGDYEAGEAIVVDPSFDPHMVIQRAAKQNLKIKYVINTHGHKDHVNGNGVVLSVTGAPLLTHESAPIPGGVDLTGQVKAEHGQAFKFGSYDFTCLHTPGHSDDHICILVNDENVCLTGDALFVGKIGGTSSAAAAEAQYLALHEVLLKLREEITVWPGHDYGCRPSSTIGLEKRTNPFLLTDRHGFMDLKKNWPQFKKERGLK
jgi:glyoxylase-like metal-dependent hydrolase (beta-lactamase superfamily II)